ncbi:MAG: hypothetical protein EZS28_003627 [Streblomastix strix]|uniref:Anoctamin transmembrane domain-containing protein n=1 Tax=Streblomastix strix TaxID=222440 RepID=A0A5J4X270_9EUKA|nr:MAG: hypothetical protein EZS28_003627 [Streblomastix strix]
MTQQAKISGFVYIITTGKLFSEQKTWTVIKDNRLIHYKDESATDIVKDIYLMDVQNVVEEDDDKTISLVIGRKMHKIKPKDQYTQWLKQLSAACSVQLPQSPITSPNMYDEKTRKENEAAIKIQKTYRGYSVRKIWGDAFRKITAQVHAVMIIQRCWRAHQRRRNALVDDGSGKMRQKLEMKDLLAAMKEHKEKILITDFVLVFENLVSPEDASEKGMKSMKDDLALRKARMEREARKREDYQERLRMRKIEEYKQKRINNKEFDDGTLTTLRMNQKLGIAGDDDVIEDHILKRNRLKKQKAQQKQKNPIYRKLKVSKDGKVDENGELQFENEDPKDKSVEDDPDDNLGIQIIEEDDEDTRCCGLLKMIKGISDREKVVVKDLIMRRMRERELLLEEKVSTDQKLIFVNISATFEALCIQAELKHFKKLLKPENVKVDGGSDMVDFVSSQRGEFLGIDEPETFFYSAERKKLIYDILTDIMVEEEDVVGSIRYGDMLIMRALAMGYCKAFFPVHEEDQLEALKKRWIWSLKKQPSNMIAQYFGEKVALYFVYLGFYTKWLIPLTIIGIIVFIVQEILSGDQAMALSGSIFSIIVCIWSAIFTKAWKRNEARKTYSWNTFNFSEIEKPRPKFDGKIERSKITGKLEREYPSSKRMQKYMITIPISLIMVIIDIVVIFLLTYYENPIIDAIKGGRTDLHFVVEFIIDLIPSILNAVVSIIFGFIYSFVATACNKWENYKTQSQYDNMIIFRMVSAAVINQFFSMVYIVFSHNPFNDDVSESFSDLRTRLITMFIIYFLKTQVLSNILPMAIVFLKWSLTEMKKRSIRKKKEEVRAMVTQLKENQEHEAQLQREANQNANAYAPPTEGGVRGRQQKKNQTAENQQNANQNNGQQTQRKKKRIRTISPAQLEKLRQQKIELLQIEKEMASLPTKTEVEMGMGEYDTFDDFQELVMQFGFITLFAPAFPLAALFSFVGNVIQLRSDPAKICFSMQRPIPISSASIGSFLPVLNFMTYAAVIMNLGIMFFCFRSQLTTLFIGDQELTSTGQMVSVIIFFGVENVLILAAALISIIVSSVPQDVKDLMRRDEITKRETLVLLKQHEREERLKQYYNEQLKLYEQRENQKKSELVKQFKEDLEKRQQVAEKK